MAEASPILGVSGCVLFIGLIFLLAGGIHKIEEGHVGVYFRGGALLSDIAEPGYHVMLPFMTNYENVQVTVQTDKVTDIPCGTSGGVLIYFEKIEVVNRLDKNLVYDTVKNYTIHYDKTWIYDKIHHEINQFCSKHTLQEVYIEKFDTLDEELVQALQKDVTIWAPGITIIAIRVTKPVIPIEIKRNYEDMEKKKTDFMIAIEKQKVAEKEADTRRKTEAIRAQSQLDVSKINMEREINERESQKRMESIQDEIYLAKEKSRSDAEYYQKQKAADGNQLYLTKDYLKLEAIKALSNNSRLYFGESIPKVFTTSQEFLQ